MKTKIFIVSGILNLFNLVTFAQTYPFPFYIKTCVVSQPSAIGIFTRNARSPGHSVLYLHGACKDKNSAYSKLEKCSNQDGQDLSESPLGSLVSVNEYSEKSVWTAIEGHYFAFFGNAPKGEFMCDELKFKAREEALKQGIYRGLTLTQAKQKNKESEYVR